MRGIAMSKVKISGKVDQTKWATGHRPHRSGAGKHQHRNNKRLKTRMAKFRNELQIQGV